MYLLKNIDNNFTFDKILQSGYQISEKNNQISKVQFVNGKRKRIDTEYEDCIIKINLGGIDAEDLQDYIDNLTDGNFQYYSFKYQEYKNAQFLVDVPELIIEKVYDTDNFYLGDLEVILEKSDDYVAS